MDKSKSTPAQQPDRLWNKADAEERYIKKYLEDGGEKITIEYPDGSTIVCKFVELGQFAYVVETPTAGGDPLITIVLKHSIRRIHLGAIRPAKPKPNA